ncbi:unnamed protein product [Ceutorhynchus assimilis]|uniref:Ankyrin repeat protein n=1 Tax=Ceutorhynchus assimilis TaxID=467358 RepID=A0A9N9QJJ2_9CUCU|nr:unnamed protein product [Ceutorhynchus assimilis]
MARALVNNYYTQSAYADVLRANSAAFFYKLDEMEFHVKKASHAYLQDNEKYILCLETPETTLMSVLLAHSLRKLNKDNLLDLVFTDFHNFIRTNTQQNENSPNFPDILVCKVDVNEQLNQCSELLTSWARLVKNESKKIIFIIKDSKYLEQTMIDARMVYVLKLKFTELWEENKTSNNEENKVGNNQENLNIKTMNDVLNNAVSNAGDEAIKAKEETNEKSALPTEAEIQELTAILKLHGIESVNAVDKQGQNNTPLHLAAKNGQNKIVKVLLLCDAGMELKNYEGHTPLYLAAEGGHHKVVSTLLENGANPNALNAITARISNKETPLHMACYNNDVRSVELLLKFGTSIDTKDKDGYTPLHLAIEQEHYEVVSILLENNANINRITTAGQIPLEIASSKNNVRLMELLLKFGAEIETKTLDGNTLLHLATQKSHHEIVNTLLENNANINAINKVGQTPLQIAFSKNDVRLIKLFLKFGAEIETNTVDGNGNTLLHLATQKSHHETVNTLLENNANINVINKVGQTPLQIAFSKNDVRLIELFLKFGAEIETKTVDGNTLLHLATQKGDHSVVGTLLENNANINAINNAGQTPIHMASCKNDVQLIELLLKFGANIETKQAGNGMTPLHIASSSGHNSVVTTLLEHGSNINAQDNNGHTPLHHAIQINSQQVVTNLLQNGVDPNLQNNSKQTAVDYARYFGRSTLIHLIEKYDGWN